MQIPTDLEHTVVKTEGRRTTNEMNRDDDEIRKIAEHYKAKAIERLKKNRALQIQEVEQRLWGPQGCSKSPSNFPIVTEMVLRDARKLKKRLVGAPGFEPGGLLRPRQARWPNNRLLAAQL